jgi:TonB family protein
MHLPIIFAILYSLSAKSQDAVKPGPHDTLNPASVVALNPDKLDAKFLGEGAIKFHEWIQQNLVYPPDALKRKIYGDVLVQYTITPAGKITDVILLNGRHPLLDAEAVRVVQSSPDWEPAIKAGKNIEQRNVINVSFKSQQDALTGIENQDSIDDGPAFVIVELDAVFQGGDINSFRKWIQQNLIYPPKAKEQGIYGRLTVQFQVDSYGKVVNVKVLRSPDPIFNDETVRVICSSPRWTPAMQLGRNVKQMFVIPVDFNLSDPPP